MLSFTLIKTHFKFIATSEIKELTQNEELNTLSKPCFLYSYLSLE